MNLYQTFMAGLLHHRNKSFIGPHSLDVLSIIFGGLLEAVRFLLLIILLCCSTVTFCERLSGMGRT
jgi:hypothetical protein